MVRGIADAQKIYYLANNTYATTFADLGFYGAGNTSTNFETSWQRFKWGRCLLEVNGTSPYVYCINNAINMTYLIDLNSQRAACVAYDNDKDTLSHQLCRAETGAQTSSSRFWYYYN